MFCMPTWQSCCCSVAAVLRGCTNTTTNACTNTHTNCTTDTVANDDTDVFAHATYRRPLARSDSLTDALSNAITPDTCPDARMPGRRIS